MFNDLVKGPRVSSGGHIERGSPLLWSFPSFPQLYHLRGELDPRGLTVSSDPGGQGAGGGQPSGSRRPNRESANTGDRK